MENESQSKHTLGQWEVNTQAGRPNREVFAGDTLVCDCGVADTGLVPFEEVEANARLIAMAPELLEACKYALEFYDSPMDFMPRLKTVIAKTEERQ